MRWERESAPIGLSGTKRFAKRMSVLRISAAARKYTSYNRSSGLEAHSIEHCIGFSDSKEAVLMIESGKRPTVFD